MAWVQAFPTAATLISQSVQQIQDNWLYLQQRIESDHYFITGLADGYHKQVTFVNRADPVVLPAGQNGIFYESGTRFKGYDGTQNFFMPPLLASVVFNNLGVVSGTATNVAGVVKNGVGDFTINFTTALPSTNGPWTASAFSNNTTIVLTAGLTQYAVGSVRILVKNAATGVTTDPVLACFTVNYGY